MRIFVNQKIMSMDKGIKFYSRSMTLSLRDNAKETFPTDNEGKSVVARRLIRIVQINKSQKSSYIKTSYFSVLHTSSKNEIKVELDLSNYAINSDLKKNATHSDASKLAKKTNLTSLESDADDLHIDKLKNIPVNLDS